MHWKKGELEVERWVKEIEAFGYQFGPARKEGSRRSIDLPLRLGISAAIAINVMLFSVSFYFGLEPDDPEVFRLFTRLSFALSTGTVVIGGWPFFQAAVRGLARACCTSTCRSRWASCWSTACRWCSW